MTDDIAFERRLESAFARYVEAAPVTIQSTVLAAQIVRRQAIGTPARLTGRPQLLRRLALLSLVAVVAASIVVFGSGRFRVTPAPTPSPRVTASAPAASATQLAGEGAAWTALYARRSLDRTSVEIVTVAPDGKQRTVRAIPTNGPDALRVSDGGVASRTGWVFLYGQDYPSTVSGTIAVFDLSSPSTSPLLVSFNAPIGPRWSATGLLAVPGYHATGPMPSPGGPEQWAVITILDPATRATQRIGEVSLYGGGPSIVWALDGSGIWDGRSLRPIDGGSDVDIAADQLFVDRRLGAGGAETGNDAIFASDGRAQLSVADRLVNGRHVAVVSRAEGGNAVDVAQWPLPNGAFSPRLGEPDPSDSEFPISYLTGQVDAPDGNQGPIVHVDGSTTGLPGAFFLGWVPQALADSWPPAR